MEARPADMASLRPKTRDQFSCPPSAGIRWGLCLLIVSPVLRIEAVCVTSCDGKLMYPFSYQSCDSCTKYVTCDMFGRLTTSDCLFGSVFDDRLKLCLPFSGSCQEFFEGSVRKTSEYTTTKHIVVTSAKLTSAPAPDKETSSQEQKEGSSLNPNFDNISSTMFDDPYLARTIPARNTDSHQSTPTDRTHLSTDPLRSTTSLVQSFTPGAFQQKQQSANLFLSESIYTKTTVKAGKLCADSFISSTTARSKIECGSLCSHDNQCWYFRVQGHKCFLYPFILQTCDMIIYKYMG